MADYEPKYISTMDCRNFFTPPINYDDLDQATLLLYIESVEKYVESVFGASSPNTARIPCLLLLASKIVMSGELVRKYYTLSEETLGDYHYKIASPVSRSSDVQSSPYVIAKTWEQMALEMLSAAEESQTWKVFKAND